MRRLIFLVALMSGCVSPAFAQPTDTTLKARVAWLEKVLGNCAIRPDMSNRPTELPSGEYPVCFRQRQLGLGIDDNNATVTSLRLQLSGLAAQVAAIPANAGTTTTINNAYPDIIDQGNGELIYLGKDTGGSRQGGIRGDFKLHFGINNYDGGGRALINWACFNPQLPESTFGVDSHGAFSYNGNPCPRGTWSQQQTYGQAVVIDGGWSQAAYDYTTGAQLPGGILFASQRNAMPIYFAVTPTRNVGDPVQNKAVMKLNSDNSQNPVEIVMNGRLQRLVPCNINGQQVVCFQGGTALGAGPRGAAASSQPDSAIDPAIELARAIRVEDPISGQLLAELIQNLTDRAVTPDLASRTRQRRDVTRALLIVKRLKAHNQQNTLSKDLDELVQILTDIDARTGHRDPSKR